MYIFSKENSKAFDSGFGEIVYEISGHETGSSTQHSLAYVDLLPGSSSLKHYHPTAEESYYILEGEARIEIDDESAMLKPGQTVVIPPKAVHQIFNESDKTLQFIAVCAPAWTPECSVFVDERLEQTTKA